MKYSIKQLEKLSGIKAHTIRAWESRYAVFEPDRTEGNTRIFSDADLRKLLNLKLLIDQGARISSLAELSTGELNSRVKELNRTPMDGDQPLIDTLVRSSLNMDEELFNNAYQRIILRHGVVSGYQNVILPFLQRLGILWQTAAVSPAQEHFASHMIRRKLFSAIDQTPMLPDGEKWLLFLHQNEEHELPLLVTDLILRQQGRRVLYLGARVPDQSITHSLELWKPDRALTFLVSSVRNTKALLKELAETCSPVPLLVAGDPRKTEREDSIKSLEELLALLHP